MKITNESFKTKLDGILAEASRGHENALIFKYGEVCEGGYKITRTISADGVDMTNFELFVGLDADRNKYGFTIYLPTDRSTYCDLIVNGLDDVLHIRKLLLITEDENGGKKISISFDDDLYARMAYYYSFIFSHLCFFTEVDIERAYLEPIYVAKDNGHKSKNKKRKKKK